MPGFVLDGFPRTMPQADALDALLDDLGRGIDVVLEFQVPDREQLLERMLKRAAEEGRSDDTPEAIGRRLELYDRETAPLVEYYRSSAATSAASTPTGRSTRSSPRSRRRSTRCSAAARGA